MPSDETCPFVRDVLDRLCLASLVIATMEMAPSTTFESFMQQLQSKTLSAQTGIGLVSSSNSSHIQQPTSTGSPWLKDFTASEASVEKEAQYLLDEMTDYVQSKMEMRKALLESALYQHIAKMAEGE